MSAFAPAVRAAAARLRARDAEPRTRSPVDARSRIDDGRSRWTPETVVVGFDGSPAAARGLERAAGVVADSGVLIIVAVEPEVYSRGLLSESLLDVNEFSAAALLRQAREQLRARSTGKITLVRRGDPADELVDVARERGADLVVVGRQGRDFAARVLMGSVAARIVANAPCDVLVVS